VPANMIDPKDNTEMQQTGDQNSSTGDDNA